MWVRERDVLISGSLKNGSSRPSEREVGFVFASLPQSSDEEKVGRRPSVHPGSDLVKFADTGGGMAVAFTVRTISHD